MRKKETQLKLKMSNEKCIYTTNSDRVVAISTLAKMYVTFSKLLRDSEAS